MVMVSLTTRPTVQVLVCAPSHAACDAAVLCLAAHWPGGAGHSLVRLGSLERLTSREVEQFLPEKGAGEEGDSPLARARSDLQSAERKVVSLHSQLLEGGRGRGEVQLQEQAAVARASASYRELEETAVTGASVVVCTLMTAARGWLMQRLSDGELGLLCVDEAGQTLDSSLLPLLGRARRMVLAGDHLQLPPTVLSKEGVARGLATSLLERLALARPGVVSLLSTQYRSHPAIAAWSSQYFYGGKVRAATGLENR